MEWKSRVTELLGCKYPIFQGAIAHLGGWKFATAVAEAGAHGTITASLSRTPEQLRKDIINCRESTSGSFGVNFSIGICPRIEEMLDVCIEERIPIETSVYKPDALANRIKDSGLPWIHKAARIKDAIHAQEVGADAIILVGLEGAGIKNPEQLPTLTTITWGRKFIKVPLIAAGGIADAHGFLAAMSMGADGIMMGSAFMATRECPLNEANKRKIVALNPGDPELRKYVMTPTQLRTPGEPADIPHDIDWSKVVSFATGSIDRVMTVKELVEGIVSGAGEIINGWGFATRITK